VQASYPSDKSNAKADRNDRAFLLGAGKEFEPWVPLYDELSYPSGTSNAKADRNDKAFLLGERKGFEPKGSSYSLLKRASQAIPPAHQTQKLTAMMRLFCCGILFQTFGHSNALILEM
jgi:hypothetical protein